MIILASYKTDIPAFYGAWFRKRLAAGQPIAARLKGKRPDCRCHQSRDIGAYDTCPHDCVYCYAVQNRGGGAAALCRARPQWRAPVQPRTFHTPGVVQCVSDVP